MHILSAKKSDNAIRSPARSHSRKEEVKIAEKTDGTMYEHCHLNQVV